MSQVISDYYYGFLNTHNFFLLSSIKKSIPAFSCYIIRSLDSQRDPQRIYHALGGRSSVYANLTIKKIWSNRSFKFNRSINFL